jgi:hypothetical protein
MVVLGLLSRWDLPFAVIPEGSLYSIGQVVLLHSKSSIYSLTQLLNYLLDPLLWGAWGVAVGGYLLAIWRVELLNYLRPSVRIAFHLLAGAALSMAFDLLFFRGGRHTIEFDVAGWFSINLTIACLVMLGSISYLLVAVLNRSWKLTSQYRLSSCRTPGIHINSLPRGVDNVHIDVLLSGKFCKTSNLSIQNLIPVVVSDLQAGKRKVRLPKNQLKPLHDIFSQLVEQTLRRAKESGEKELIELMVIAVFKYIHQEVARAVDGYVRQRADGLNSNYQKGAIAERDRNFVEYIVRHKENVSAAINELILSSLAEGHQLPFHKALKSFLGIRDSFSIQLIQTPMALCGYSQSDLALLNNYLLTGLLRKSDNHFYKVDAALSGIFQPYLPLLDKPEQESACKHLHEGFVNEKMDMLLQPSVFMETANITKLLDTEWTRLNIEQATKEGGRARRAKLKRHLQFQLSVIYRVEQELRRLPLSHWLVASYQLKEILSQINTDIAPSVLLEMLVNAASWLELDERIKKNTTLNFRPFEMELVRHAWDVVHHGSSRFIHDNLLRMMRDFSRYRRDLLVQSQLLQSYNYITLITDLSDIQTSRANFTLHEFSVLSEINDQPGPVRSHIIVKADLRGSTQVTDRLVELSLNPATHFERNFFTPVNALIEQYGAEKVFIEGDALILILNDYESKNSNHHIASRACGLAANILKVVAKQNVESKCYGLPELELGIGIAYCHNSPRYLFDGDHRITISPGINRADRLSACAWSVREWRERQLAPMTQVEVYIPFRSAEGFGTKAQKEMVFNLNGILIEPSVFEKLQKEVSLKRVQNKIATMQDSKLFSLVFPDLAGGVHRMIIREAPVKFYDHTQKYDESPLVADRHFYEVVYQKSLLDQLRK